MIGFLLRGNHLWVSGLWDILQASLQDVLVLSFNLRHSLAKLPNHILVLFVLSLFFQQWLLVTIKTWSPSDLILFELGLKLKFHGLEACFVFSLKGTFHSVLCILESCFALTGRLGYLNGGWLLRFAKLRAHVDLRRLSLPLRDPALRSTQKPISILDTVSSDTAYVLLCRDNWTVARSVLSRLGRFHVRLSHTLCKRLRYTMLLSSSSTQPWVWPALNVNAFAWSWFLESTLGRLCEDWSLTLLSRHLLIVWVVLKPHLVCQVLEIERLVWL